MLKLRERSAEQQPSVSMSWAKVTSSDYFFPLVTELLQSAIKPTATLRVSRFTMQEPFTPASPEQSRDLWNGYYITLSTRSAIFFAPSVKTAPVNWAIVCIIHETVCHKGYYSDVTVQQLSFATQRASQKVVFNVIQQWGTGWSFVYMSGEETGSRKSVSDVTRVRLILQWFSFPQCNTTQGWSAGAGAYDRGLQEVYLQCT